MQKILKAIRSLVVTTGLLVLLVGWFAWLGAVVPTSQVALAAKSIQPIPSKDVIVPAGGRPANREQAYEQAVEVAKEQNEEGGGKSLGEVEPSYEKPIAGGDSDTSLLESAKDAAAKAIGTSQKG
jgi:hypothetical protein